MPPCSAPKGFFFRGQVVHLLVLSILIAGVVLLADYQSLAERQLFGVGAHIWFVVALAVPIVHQIYVWLAWRSALCFEAIIERLGSRAFLIYQIVFFVLLLARPISLTFLAIADHDSLKMPISLRVGIGVVLGIPATYTFYSVARYFGFARAAGIDHFDESYRSKLLVREGVFRYTSNSMYSFAFLAFWLIAVAGASRASLVVAAFSHAYIWVHYYCTERPDMKLIYGSR